MKSSQILVFLALFTAFAAGGHQKGDRADPCKVDLDCATGLLCQNNQICGCPLGHFNGDCLQPLTREEDECHVDGQCYDLFGNHSMCHFNTERSKSQCECPPKYKLVAEGEGDAASASKQCRLTCEKDEDCSGSGAEAAAGQQLQECVQKGTDNAVDSLGLCQPRKAEDSDKGTEKKKSGLSVGGVFGILIVIAIVVGLGVAFYNRRRILQRFGY